MALAFSTNTRLWMQKYNNERKTRKKNITENQGEYLEKIKQANKDITITNRKEKLTALEKTNKDHQIGKLTTAINELQNEYDVLKEKYENKMIEYEDKTEKKEKKENKEDFTESRQSNKCRELQESNNVYKTRNVELATSINELIKKNGELKEKHENKMIELNNEYKTSIEKLKKEHKMQIENLNKKCPVNISKNEERELTKSIKKLEEKLENREKQYNDKIQVLKTNHGKKIKAYELKKESMLKEFESEFARIEIKCKNEIQQHIALAAENRTSVEEYLKIKDKEIISLKTEIISLNKKIDALTKEKEKNSKKGWFY